VTDDLRYGDRLSTVLRAIRELGLLTSHSARSLGQFKARVTGAGLFMSQRDVRPKRFGNIGVLAAVIVTVFAGFLAFGIDVGYLLMIRTELQVAADAGALAGVGCLLESPGKARQAATGYAQLNMTRRANFVVEPGQDIALGKWDLDTAQFTPLADANAASANAVRVTCRLSEARNNAPGLIFGRLFGLNLVPLEATATARVTASRCGLVIGLDKFTMSGSSWIDSYASADGPYDPATASHNGDACSNTTIKMSGSSAIYGDAHPGPGCIVDSSSSIGVLGNEEPLQEPLVLPPVDPGDAAVNNNNLTIPLSDEGEEPLSGGEFNLSGGDHVQLSPGTYYFSKMTLSGGSSISIVGPTKIYVTGDVSLSGGSVANLTQLPINLQLYPMGSKCVISGGSQFHGAVYAPTAKVERSGDSDYYGMIVGRELVLSGGGGIHVDESLPMLTSAGSSRVYLVD
jgi:Flp pilus assembly protein TadG